MGKYWKHPEYGMVFGDELPTPRGRLIWPSIDAPKKGMANKDGSPTTDYFMVSILLPKDAATTAVFLEAVEDMTDEMLVQFNEDRAAPLGACPMIGPKCKIKDGDTLDTVKYPFYAGNYELLARNAQQPKVVDSKKETLPPTTIVGGVEGRLVIKPLVTSHGISYKLEVVQLVKDDGQRFGGGMRDASRVLDVIEDDEEESMPEPTPASELRANASKGKDAAIDVLS